MDVISSNRVVSDLIGGIFVSHHHVILAIRDTLFVSCIIGLDKFIIMSDKVEDLHNEMRDISIVLYI